jgi:catechol 2,3-dioxygenase-like lactoylglutathione lyase family enzyme
MQQVVPTLRITNYARSKAFYVDALGFQIDWEHRFEPKFPVFMQVSRDGLDSFSYRACRGLPSRRAGPFLRPRRRCLVRRVPEQGVPVKEPPNESLQGLRSMTVVDPDGNKLRICTRLKVWTRT